MQACLIVYILFPNLRMPFPYRIVSMHIQSKKNQNSALYFPTQLPLKQQPGAPPDVHGTALFGHFQHRPRPHFTGGAYRGGGRETLQEIVLLRESRLQQKLVLPMAGQLPQEIVFILGRTLRRELATLEKLQVRQFFQCSKDRPILSFNVIHAFSVWGVTCLQSAVQQQNLFLNKWKKCFVVLQAKPDSRLLNCII